MSGRLQNKVALITGTGGGQGRAAALKFAAEGALVVGCDLNAAGNEETIKLVKDAGGEMTGMAPVDLGDPDAAKAWVDAAAAVHGRVDVLYNNAGGGRHAASGEMSVEDWRFTMRNEVDLVFYTTNAAWAHLKKQGGVIISTASVAGHVGLAGMVSHCTGKGAVLSMSRAFAADGAQFGIRSVTISPGPIQSPITTAIMNDPVRAKAWADTTLMKRVGTIEEVADAAVFLASDESSYMTGTDLQVDGGKAGTRDQKGS